MAREITEDYRGKELTAVAVMTGSIIFAADLLRRMNLPLKLECVSASSYHGGTASSGEVRFGDLPDLSGRHVLILDDILDTGLTLHALCERISEQSRPLSVEVCVLLRKRKVRGPSIDARYAGFDIGDEFVVGYGLDYQGEYRNLPFVATLRPEIVEATAGEPIS